MQVSIANIKARAARIPRLQPTNAYLQKERAHHLYLDRRLARKYYDQLAWRERYSDHFGWEAMMHIPEPALQCHGFGFGVILMYL